MYLEWIIPTIILAVAAIDDIRSRKVHNPLIVTSALLALAHVLYFEGASGLPLALLGAFAAFTLTFPLYYLGVIGAGDSKIMVAFGLLSSWDVLFTIILASLVWGALLGVIKIALSGDFKKIVRNIHATLLSPGSVLSKDLHTIPFTIPLLLGWLTHITIQQTGGNYL